MEKHGDTTGAVKDMDAHKWNFESYANDVTNVIPKIDHLLQFADEIAAANIDKYPDAYKNDNEYWIFFEDKRIDFSLAIIERKSEYFNSQESLDDAVSTLSMSGSNTKGIYERFYDKENDGGVYANELYTIDKCVQIINDDVLAGYLTGAEVPNMATYYDTLITRKYAILNTAVNTKYIAEQEGIDFMVDVTKEELDAQFSEAKADYDEWSNYLKSTMRELFTFTESELIPLLERTQAMDDLLAEIAVKAYECTDNESLAEVKAWQDEVLPESVLEHHNEELSHASEEAILAAQLLDMISKLPHFEDHSDGRFPDAMERYNFLLSAPRFRRIEFADTWVEQGDGRYRQHREDTGLDYYNEILTDYSPTFFQLGFLHIGDKYYQHLNEYANVALDFEKFNLDSKLPEQIEKQ